MAAPELAKPIPASIENKKSFNWEKYRAHHTKPIHPQDYSSSNQMDKLEHTKQARRIAHAINSLDKGATAGITPGTDEAVERFDQRVSMIAVEKRILERTLHVQEGKDILHGIIGGYDEIVAALYPADKTGKTKLDRIPNVYRPVQVFLDLTRHLDPSRWGDVAGSIIHQMTLRRNPKIEKIHDQDGLDLFISRFEYIIPTLGSVIDQFCAYAQFSAALMQIEATASRNAYSGGITPLDHQGSQYATVNTRLNEFYHDDRLGAETDWAGTRHQDIRGQIDLFVSNNYGVLPNDYMSQIATIPALALA